MTTKPISNLITRDLNPNLSDFLNDLSQHIGEVVNFGSNVFHWCFAKISEEKYTPIIVMIRNFLENLDAVASLIKESHVEPAKILVRTLLETTVSVEYLFEKDADERLMALTCCYIHDRIKDAKVGDPSSEESKKFLSTKKKDKFLKNVEVSFPKLESVHKKVKELEDILKQPEYIMVEAEWQRTRGKRNGAIKWYQLWDGPGNLEQLAERIGYPAVYEILYRPWSDSVHGTVINGIVGASTEEGNGLLLATRNPEDSQHLTFMSISSAVTIFGKLIGKFRSDKGGDFDFWYKLEMRDFCRRIAGNPPLNISKS